MALQAVLQFDKSTIVRIIGAILLTLFWAAPPAFGQIPEPGLSTMLRIARETAPPLALTPEMKKWVHRHVSMSAPPDLRWRRLARLLVHSSELRLTETRLGTVTAAEVFLTRRANCVAFAHLAVAMAREVGLPAEFVLMKEIEGYEGRGDLRIAYGHLAAGFGPQERRTVLDLGGLSRPPKRRLRTISDRTALAIFYSNRGAERLIAGDSTTALLWLRGAVGVDPSLPRAWVNLGVAERRSGRPEEARKAYLRALEIDPDLVPAHENLKVLKERRARECCAP